MSPIEPLKCAFCGKTEDAVAILIKGQDACICADCVLVCQQTVEERAAQSGECVALASASGSLMPAELAISKATHRHQFWWSRPFPRPPADADPAELPPDKREELIRALIIVGMIEKKSARGWNERSVNRRAQHRWPESKYVIDDIYRIVDTWLQFGLPGLIEMVRQGRQLSPSSERVSYAPVDHVVKDMAAIEAQSVPDIPVFLSHSVETMVKCHPELRARLYLVALETQFGRYRFGLVHPEPPAPVEAADFACVATRIATVGGP